MRRVIEGQPVNPPGFDFPRACLDHEVMSHGYIAARRYEVKWGKQELDPQKKTLLVLVDPQDFLATRNPITQRLGGLSVNYTMTSKWLDLLHETATKIGSENILVTRMVHDPENLSTERERQLGEGPCASLTHRDPQERLRFPHLEKDSPLTQIDSRLTENIAFQTMVKSGRSLLKDPRIKKLLQKYRQVAICGVDATFCIATTIIDYFEGNGEANWKFSLSLLPQLISDRSKNFQTTEEMYRLIIEMGVPKMITIETWRSYLKKGLIF